MKLLIVKTLTDEGATVKAYLVDDLGEEYEVDIDIGDFLEVIFPETYAEPELDEK